MRLRVTASRWRRFLDLLTDDDELETAGIILAERLPGADVLVASRLLRAPDDGYEIRRPDQLRLTPVAINRLVRPARDAGLSVFTVHTHPGTASPSFSHADDAGDSRLMPSFFAQCDGPHGSLVVAGQTGRVLARAWREPGVPVPVTMQIVGERLELAGPVGQTHGQQRDPRFDRQILALGEDGQRVLRTLRVGVVGLGGTGSVVSSVLAHLGVGELVLVDGDLVEVTNLSRVLAATAADVGRHKVEVAARYARGAGLGTAVAVHPGHLGREVAPGVLAGCDVVLCCVDRHTPRALLNRLAYAAHLPLIDMGSAFRVDRTGTVTSSGGRVVIVGPDRPCLACWGHLDPERLRLEALPEPERTRQAADGYIDGAEVAQPSVVAFNTVIAGAAAVELLRLVTGFADSSPPLRLAFDFSTAEVRRNRLAGSASCQICSRRAQDHAGVAVL